MAGVGAGLGARVGGRSGFVASVVTAGARGVARVGGGRVGGGRAVGVSSSVRVRRVSVRGGVTVGGETYVVGVVVASVPVRAGAGAGASVGRGRGVVASVVALGAGGVARVGGDREVAVSSSVRVRRVRVWDGGKVGGQTCIVVVVAVVSVPVRPGARVVVAADRHVCVFIFRWEK